MSNNAPDYNDNLAFDPNVDKRYSESLLEENAKLKKLLKECGEYLMCIDRNPQLVEQIIELLGEE